MRRFLSLFAFLLFAGPAAADAPGAQAAYAERRALLEADSVCHLFTPDIRHALEAGAWQARGALLREGWTRARLAELEQAAVRAARGRACSDPRTLDAAARAREGFQSWLRLHVMDFPGGERGWLARRTPDPAGFLIVQNIPAPRTASFGIREDAVALSMPFGVTAPPPASAELIMRDPARARTTLFDVPGRAVHGLEAGAPSLATAQRFMANARRIETVGGVRRVIFTFPTAAIQAMAALDPREAVIVQLGEQRLLIEVGDIAAARAFVAAHRAAQQS